MFLTLLFRHLACEDSQLEAAKLLIAYGADLSAENKAKKTPIHLCSPSNAKLLSEMASSKQ